MAWALNNGPWSIGGRILFLECWSKNYDFSSNVSTLVLVWLYLPELPKKLFSRKAVIALASRVGTPLVVDMASLETNSSLCARVKVLCDLAALMLGGFQVEVNGFFIWQRFRYGSFLKPCSTCELLGHADSICAAKQPGPTSWNRGHSKSRFRHLVPKRSAAAHTVIAPKYFATGHTCFPTSW